MKAILTIALLATPVLAEELIPDDFAEARGVDIVLLGELHDNPHHHVNQVIAINAIEPAAVVFEMLTTEQAKRITPNLLNDFRALSETLDWTASGWPAFSMYFPIIQASSKAQILGAQVPRDTARSAILGGNPVESFGADAELFGLTKILPDAQQADREGLQMAAHCDAMPETMLPSMVMVQRLRDATLAKVATQALEATGGPVIVITGNGHARTDWGVPALLPEGISFLSIAQLEAKPEPSQPHDFWIITEPVNREDPCKAFQ